MGDTETQGKTFTYTCGLSIQHNFLKTESIINYFVMPRLRKEGPNLRIPKTFKSFWQTIGKNTQLVLISAHNNVKSL